MNLSQYFVSFLNFSFQFHFFIFNTSQRSAVFAEQKLVVFTPKMYFLPQLPLDRAQITNFRVNIFHFAFQLSDSKRTYIYFTAFQAMRLDKAPVMTQNKPSLCIWLSVSRLSRCVSASTFFNSLTSRLLSFCCSFCMSPTITVNYLLHRQNILKSSTRL